ncbi:MAG: TolC family outer membrane protein [Methylocystis sp.]
MRSVGAILCLLSCFAAAEGARADTIKDALGHAYLAHPQLNAQRADTRSVDENLPIVTGTFLPTVTAQGNYGLLQQDILASTGKSRTLTQPKAGGLVVSWNIFNGFRGLNGIDQAQAQIHQSRQSLRYAELQVLGAAATAYMNLLRDVAIYNLRDDYVKVLANQVDITNERLRGGEVTRTDVYQAEAALEQAKEERSTAAVNLQASIATYRQQTKLSPKNLMPAPPLDGLLPKDKEAALRIADTDHPLALAARYNVDVNELNVKLAEGQLLPTVGLVGNVNQNYDYIGTSGQRFFQAGASVNVNVPIYEGGVNYGQIRQAKEKLGQARFIFDQQIDQIHQSVEASWAAWKQTTTFLIAAKQQVAKAESALAGIREEAKFGQRTTFEILQGQLVLVNARTALVTGQYSRVISTYNLLAAIGHLSAQTLALDVPLYSPLDHYEGVQHQWIGTEPWK